MKTAIAALSLLLTLILTPLALAASLPGTAQQLANDLDAQLAERLGLPFGNAKGVSLILTTPVSLTDLEYAPPLSLALAEELATCFVRAGYRVQEARRGEHLLFHPEHGEMLLTRRSDFLAKRNLPAEVILTGTFSQTLDSVRFNIRLMAAESNEIVAMSSATLPVTGEVLDLLPRQSANARLGRMTTSVGVDLGM